MKYFIGIILAGLVVGTAVYAESMTDDFALKATSKDKNTLEKVPTGYQVKGCTYVAFVQGKEVCLDKKAGSRTFEKNKGAEE